MIKLQFFRLQLYLKATPAQMLFSEFWKNFKTRFFKYTSGRLLLSEHWVSLKKAPIAIAINISNASYQKEFVLSLRFAYGKFVEISLETFVGVFLVLEFSLPSEFYRM